MANDLLGQILGSAFGGARDGQQSPAGGGLGGLLGGILGSNTGSVGGLGGPGGATSAMGGKGALMTMLLPLAMQWVQRNGGVGALLQRFQQKGYSQQAASWVSTGSNEELPPQAVGEVVGMDELSRLSQQLGASHEEVSAGMAQILPEVVNHLTPEGNMPDNSDDMLSRGMSLLEQFMNSAQRR